MLEPIHGHLARKIEWQNLYPEAEFNSPSSKAKTDLHAADDEVVASLYYQNTLQSLKPLAESTSKQSQEAISASKLNKKEKTFTQKVTDWLWNLLGKNQNDENLNETEFLSLIEEDFSNQINNTPRLQNPEKIDNKKLDQTLFYLNQDFVYHLKDVAEFEEEMRNSGSNRLDKLIYKELIYHSLFQKNIKEKIGMIDQQDLLDLHKKNKSLQQKHYQKVDEILDRDKANKYVQWINVGATAGLTGIIAITFATGGAGAVLNVVSPLLTLVKGGAMMTEGILKYKNDLSKGELFIISKETKNNSNAMSDKLDVLNVTGEEIYGLLKTIRHHLENQSQAERIFNNR